MELKDIQELLKDSKEMAGTLYGTLLGDASLTKPNPGNSRLTFGQSNKDYAEWKAGLFTSIGVKTPTLYGTTWRAQSPRLPLFTGLYNQMYYEGRKTVPIHAMKTITPLGLALLYMDDGDFHKQKQEVKIATMSFNQAEHEVLQKGLFKRFNLHFNVHQRSSHGGNRKSHYYYLRMKQSDRLDFFSLIQPYVPECMSYKLPTAEGMEKIETRSRLNSDDVDTLLSNQKLFDLHYVRGLNFHQMAEELGVNSGTIHGRIQKLESKLAEYLH